MSAYGNASRNVDHSKYAPYAIHVLSFVLVDILLP
jgi:hypothetical protein